MNRRSLLGLLVGACAMIGAGIVSVPAIITGVSPLLARRRRAVWRAIGQLERFPLGEVRQAEIPHDRSVWPRSTGPQAVFVWRHTPTDCIVFSRSCTDLGCPLQYDPGSACFFCPCHGGIFKQDGERLGGPPARAMYRYARRIREGTIEIDLASLPVGA